MIAKGYFTILLVSLSPLLWAGSPSESEIMDVMNRAYNYDKEAFDWFETQATETEDSLLLFLAASGCYWEYQSDRIDSGKRDQAKQFLDKAIDYNRSLYKNNRDDPQAKFICGISYCSRARFNVEEEQWFQAYLDAREGMGLLESLVEDYPDFQDAYFALGVAECFLSDAPFILKPLARLIGFRGSVTEGVRKLELSIQSGKWTSIEAEYYLAYFYYKVDSNGPETIRRFQSLLDRYPKNPMFGYFLGRGYQINNEPLKALEAYRGIRDNCYEVDAIDMGNWVAYRIGNILQGEHRYLEALKEYNCLVKRLNESTHRQEYFYQLPLKMAECFIGDGDNEKARSYLEVIQREWDSDTYRRARSLLRDLNK
jgi:tetratricopeptide (TPR) repeat protein